MRWINERLAAYEHVCRVYDAYLETLEPVCEKGCDTCCTVNVTVTSLEAWRIADYLVQAGRADLFDVVCGAADGKRFQPTLTMNAIAEICSRGEVVPEDVMDPAWGQCPLLADHICPVYNLRPFACRCMVSTHDCRNAGYARTDDFTVTVNNIMMQYIEHIDQGGVTGNLLDMLLHMENPETRHLYAAGERPSPPSGAVFNKPATVLLARPDDRGKLSPILEQLNAQGR